MSDPPYPDNPCRNMVYGHLGPGLYFGPPPEGGTMTQEQMIAYEQMQRMQNMATGVWGGYYNGLGATGVIAQHNPTIPIWGDEKTVARHKEENLKKKPLPEYLEDAIVRGQMEMAAYFEGYDES